MYNNSFIAYENFIGFYTVKVVQMICSLLIVYNTIPHYNISNMWITTILLLCIKIFCLISDNSHPYKMFEGKTKMLTQYKLTLSCKMFQIEANMNWLKLKVNVFFSIF